MRVPGLLRFLLVLFPLGVCCWLSLLGAWVPRREDTWATRAAEGLLAWCDRGDELSAEG